MGRHCRLLAVSFCLSILVLTPGLAKEGVWQISVATGHQADAGTSARITCLIKGSRGHHQVVFDGAGRGSLLDDRQKLAAELGTPEFIEVWHDNGGTSPNWFLRSIVVRHRKSTFDIQRWKFPCFRWFGKENDDGSIRRRLRPAAKLERYVVDIKTGKQQQAGTTAKIRIALKGRNDAVVKNYQLDRPGARLVPGSTERFEIWVPPLGDIERMAIHQDGSGTSPNWFVETVVVQELERDRAWIFPFNCWLDEKNKRRAMAKPKDMTEGDGIK